MTVKIYQIEADVGYRYQKQIGVASTHLPSFRVTEGETTVAQVPSSGDLVKDAQTARLIACALSGVEFQAARAGIAPIDYADALIHGRV